MTRGAWWLLGIAVMTASPSSAQAAARPAPLAVVRAYLHGMAAHDARAVCETFSVQMRAFQARWEGGSGDCSHRVHSAHFSTVSPGFMVRTIRIVRVRSVSTDAYGNVAVRLVLFFRFPCQGAVSVIPGCRPHSEQRRDVIWLGQFSGRWRIVKPGFIYEDTSLDGSPEGTNLATAPGDRSTVSRRARLGPPPLVCPRGGVSAAGRSRSLQVAALHAKPVPFDRAPWLHIRRVAVTRLARQSWCVTITLGAPPRADSSYSLDVSQASGDGATADAYGVDIDGTGGLHPRLRDPQTLYGAGRHACRTGLGLRGNRLMLLVSPGDTVLRPDVPLQVDASSASLQPGEPLLRHPLDAADTAPSFFGLRLPPESSAGAHRCP